MKVITKNNHVLERINPPPVRDDDTVTGSSYKHRIWPGFDVSWICGNARVVGYSVDLIHKRFNMPLPKMRNNQLASDENGADDGAILLRNRNWIAFRIDWMRYMLKPQSNVTCIPQPDPNRMRGSPSPLALLRHEGPLISGIVTRREILAGIWE